MGRIRETGRRAWHLATVRLTARPVQVGLSVLGAVFIVALFMVAKSHGYDLYAYWTIDLADPYRLVGAADLSGQGSFRYAPPIALLMAPLGVLPWELIVVAWLAAQLAALWSIARTWSLALVILPPVWLDMAYGNINIFLAALIVAGFRHPAAWSFALLTKVTPGVGLAWFAVRREWRSLAMVGAVTAAVVVVSVVVMGIGVWEDWLGILTSSAGIEPPSDALPIPLLPRVLGAGLIAVFGGLTGRRWLVPVAFTFAMPTLWVIALAPLVALAAGTVRRETPS